MKATVSNNVIAFGPYDAGVFDQPARAKDVAHKVNCHDDLVEALDAMNSGQLMNTQYLGSIMHEKASKALAKARGES